MQYDIHVRISAVDSYILFRFLYINIAMIVSLVTQSFHNMNVWFSHPVLLWWQDLVILSTSPALQMLLVTFGYRYECAWGTDRSETNLSVDSISLVIGFL